MSQNDRTTQERLRMSAGFSWGGLDTGPDVGGVGCANGWLVALVAMTPGC